MLTIKSSYKQSQNFYKITKSYFVHFDPNKDYYKVLEISQTNDEKLIRNAYYELAKKFHPDTNNGEI